MTVKKTRAKTRAKKPTVTNTIKVEVDSEDLSKFKQIADDFRSDLKAAYKEVPTVSESAKFPRGSVVRLVSGGPFMTVVGWDAFDVTCAWFADDGYREQTFRPDVLLQRV